MEKELLIDGTGLLFIKTSTELKDRIDSIIKNTKIKKYRLFLKRKINNTEPINKRYQVEIEMMDKYNAEVYDDMKSEIIKIYNSNKDRYIVATLSSELFERLDGIHYDYYFKRNKFRKCPK